jgi:xanthine dehydrogenase FAD-binding subunit
VLDISFFRAHSLKEALESLHNHEGTWRVIAGGTDLILLLRDRHGNDPAFEGVVDITGLSDLRGVQATEAGLTLGALTTFSDLLRSDVVRREAPILAEMAFHMGSVQIRNRATVGGNLVNASSCADSAPPLLALDAEVALASVGGIRRVPLHEFVLGPGRTDLRPDEILTHLYFPKPAREARWGYFKLGRRNSAAISRMTVAVVRANGVGGGGTCRLAVGAVTPSPLRLRRVEQSLAEEGWSAQSIDRAAAQAREEVEKVTGIRWSSAYKLPVLESVVQRTLRNTL